MKKLIKILVSIMIILWGGSQDLHCFDEGKILFHSFEVDGPCIYSINPDGTGLKKIIKKGLYPVLSPDRSKFAYLAPAEIDKDAVKNRLIISISETKEKGTRKGDVGSNTT